MNYGIRLPLLADLVYPTANTFSQPAFFFQQLRFILGPLQTTAQRVPHQVLLAGLEEAIIRHSGFQRHSPSQAISPGCWEPIWHPFSQLPLIGGDSKRVSSFKLFVDPLDHWDYFWMENHDRHTEPDLDIYDTRRRSLRTNSGPGAG